MAQNTNSNAILAAATNKEAVRDDPGVLEAGLVELERVITESGTAAAETIVQAQKAITQGDASTAIITAAVKEGSRAAQANALISDTAKLQAQNNVIEATEAAQGAAFQEAKFNTLIEDQKRVADLLNKRQEIANDTPSSFAPFARLGHKMQMEHNDAALSAAEAQLTQTEREISGVTAATEQFARFNSMTAKVMNQGTIANNQKIVASESAKAVAETELNNAQTNAELFNRVAVARRAEMQTILQAWNIQNSVEDRKFRKVRHDFEVKNMERAAENADLKTDQLETNLALSKQALASGKATSASNIAATIAKNEEIINQIQEANAAKATRARAVQTGQRIINPAFVESPETISDTFSSGSVATKQYYTAVARLGLTGQYGGDPYEAATTMQDVDPEGTAPETPAMKMIKTAEAKMLADVAASPTGKLPKEEIEIKNLFNRTAADIYAFGNANIATGDQANPFHGPPMSVIANTYSVVRDDPFYNKYLKPMNMEELNPQTIMEVARAAMTGAGAEKPEVVAAGIEAIFDAAAAYNNTMNGGFDRFGLPNQTQYNVTLERPRTGFEELSMVGAGVTGLPIAAVKEGFKAGLTILDGEDRPITVPGFLEAKTTSVDLMDKASITKHLIKLSMSKAPTLQVPPPATSPATQ